MAKQLKKRNQATTETQVETTVQTETTPVETQTVETTPVPEVKLTLTRKTAPYTLILKQYSKDGSKFIEQEVEGRIINCSNPDIQLFLYRNDKKEYVVTEVSSSNMVRSASTMKAAIELSQQAINNNVATFIKLIKQEAKKMADNLKQQVSNEEVQETKTVDPYDAYLEANIPSEEDAVDIMDYAEDVSADTKKKEDVRVESDDEAFFDDEVETVEAEPVPDEEATLRKLTVKDLSKMAKDKGLSTSGIQRKDDFIKLIVTGVNHIEAAKAEETAKEETVEVEELTVSEQITADIMKAIETLTDKDALAKFIKSKVESVMTAKDTVAVPPVEKNETEAKSESVVSSASEASAIIIRQTASTLVYKVEDVQYTMSVGLRGMIQIKDSSDYSIKKYQRAELSKLLAEQGYKNIVEAMDEFLKPFEKFEWFTGTPQQTNQSTEQRVRTQKPAGATQGKPNQGKQSMNVTLLLGKGKKAVIPYTFVKDFKAKKPEATSVEINNAFKKATAKK